MIQWWSIQMRPKYWKPPNSALLSHSEVSVTRVRNVFFYPLPLMTRSDAQRRLHCAENNGATEELSRALILHDPCIVGEIIQMDRHPLCLFIEFPGGFLLKKCILNFSAYYFPIRELLFLCLGCYTEDRNNQIRFLVMVAIRVNEREKAYRRIARGLCGVFLHLKSVTWTVHWVFFPIFLWTNTLCLLDCRKGIDI